MDLTSINNLVKTGQLKEESYSEQEFTGLLRSGRARLKDAENLQLAVESRFDLAYNAAHSLALAELRKKSYRSSNRYILFQVLPYTCELGPEVWRVLAKCHEKRNLSEYEGYLDLDEQLLKELLNAAKILFEKVSCL